MKKIISIAALIFFLTSCVSVDYDSGSSRSSGKNNSSSDNRSAPNSSIVNPEKFTHGKFICFNKDMKPMFTVNASDVRPFSNGVAIVNSYPKGIIDTKGRLVEVRARLINDFTAPVTWASLYDKDGMSLIDKKGKVIITKNYSKVDKFQQGSNICAVYNSRKQIAFVDIKGKEVVPFGKYKKFRHQHEGLRAVQDTASNKAGFIDINGKEVITCNYNVTSDFFEGRCVVTKNKKIGYIDKTGKVVIPYKYKSGGDFRNGYAAVTQSNGKTALIDKNGKIVYTTKKGKIIKAEPNGLIQIWTRTAVSGWTNFNDQWIIKPNYYASSSFEKEGARFPYSTGQDLRNRKKACLFDSKGNIVIPAKYKNIRLGSFGVNGAIKAEISSSSADFYTLNFKLIKIPGVNIKYIYADFDSPNLVFRDDKRKYGYLSRDGKLLIEAKYEKAYKFTEGFSWAKEKIVK